MTNQKLLDNPLSTHFQIGVVQEVEKKYSNHQNQIYRFLLYALKYFFHNAALHYRNIEIALLNIRCSVELFLYCDKGGRRCEKNISEY